MRPFLVMGFPDRKFFVAHMQRKLWLAIKRKLLMEPAAYSQMVPG